MYIKAHVLLCTISLADICLQERLTNNVNTMPTCSSIAKMVFASEIYWLKKAVRYDEFNPITTVYTFE